LGLPVRRYSCRNCTWHGLRFGGYKHQNQNNESEGSEVEQLDGSEIDQFEGSEVDQLEGSEIEQFEKEMIESVPEFSEELLPVAEINTQLDGDAEFAMQNGDVDSIQVEDTVELTELISDFDEAADLEDSGAEGMVILPHEDANYAAAEADNDDSADERAGEQQISEPDEQNVELQSDVQVKVGENDAGAVSEDEDDAFDRLCHEVALSKK
jgi:hypothetical protein